MHWAVITLLLLIHRFREEQATPKTTPLSSRLHRSKVAQGTREQPQIISKPPVRGRLSEVPEMTTDHEAVEVGVVKVVGKVVTHIGSNTLLQAKDKITDSNLIDMTLHNKIIQTAKTGNNSPVHTTIVSNNKERKAEVQIMEEDKLKTVILHNMVIHRYG